MQDLIVEVDRSKRPTYSASARVRHQEYECHGPCIYDLRRDVREWFHPYLRDSLTVTGHEYYFDLRESGLIRSCLNLQDACAIKALGPKVFLENFGDQSIFFWKSVVIGESNHLFAPFLFLKRRNLSLEWQRLGKELDNCCPAVIFQSIIAL